MSNKCYAHTLDGKPPCKWQLLETHLENVASMAASFASSFDGASWAYFAGLWHDLGKYSEEFQEMLKSTEKLARVDHSTAGAQHAFALLGKNEGKLLAYVIASHHAGLLNGKSEGACLHKRLNKSIPDYSACPSCIENIGQLDAIPITLAPGRAYFQLSFFTRMVYSCVVDADCLDTEKFMNAEKASCRKEHYSLDVLYGKLKNYMVELSHKNPATTINKHRVDVLKSCLGSAALPQGLFSLTVPTGGGKTLSSLAFALKHAIKHNLRRVIYVIPYTSIIEQNANVFRDVLGNNVVIEHHSNFDPKEHTDTSRLASENWDAPIIVTTNVQFFESLFSRKSSQCRKLHNITNSVVILDEAQMLPVPLLKPCIEAIKELAWSYNTTIVMCTATQPALSNDSGFSQGLEDVREIIEKPTKLYSALKRVTTTVLSELSNEDIASKIIERYQILCIVNTRKHARQLFDQISSEVEDCYHLSALMCPVHRTERIKQIREKLDNGLPCRVISTQLIEAGVDIDFPVVYRAAAGIDSIAQAAGRCNREGKLSEGGDMYVFIPESGLPPGHFRQAFQVTRTLLRYHDDPLTLDVIAKYFKKLYSIEGGNLDKFNILRSLSEGETKGDFPFETVSQNFKIIDNDMESIIIPWNVDAENIIKEIRHAKYPASSARKAQAFTVQIYAKELHKLEDRGAIECIHDQYYVLTDTSKYNNNVGLNTEDLVLLIA